MKKCMGCMRDYSGQSETCPICGYSEKAYRETMAGDSEILSTETILGGRFILGRALSSSDYSIVYIAWDALLRRRVAVKEYFPLDLGRRKQESAQIEFDSQELQDVFESGRAVFEREAQHLGKYQDIDPLVNFYRCVRENGTSYIIMEYLEGTTLQDFLDDAPKIDPESRKAVFARLIEAVQLLHDRGIAHFNLSPDNIYIEKDGRIRFLDPGAAKKQLFRGRQKQWHMFRENFIAPEVLLGQEADKRADLYSLGAVYYYMMTGKEPKSSLRRNKRNNALRMNNKTDERIVNSLMGIYPDQRPAGISQLWQQCSGEERRRFLGYGQK